MLGRHKIFPPLAAQPYTEIEGNNQYLRMLFTCGYGPLALSDFKIGDTPLDNFTGVEKEIRYGYLTDPPLSLFSNSVHEDALSIALTVAAGGQIRTSQPNADELSVDFTFPALVIYDPTTGARNNRTVQVKVEYRVAGSGGAWTQVDGTPAVAAVVTTAQGSNRDLRFTAATAGQAGNAISVKYVDPGTDGAATESVAVTGSAITVTLRNVAGVRSTGLQVKAALEASAAAAALIAIALAPGSDGTGNIMENLVEYSIFNSEGFPWIGGQNTPYQLAGGANIIALANITAASPTTVRYGVRWPVSTGQYEVQCTRVTADNFDAIVQDKSFWSALRTIRHVAPVSLAGQVLIALRIKATDQLNGVISQLNCIAFSILKDWTGTAWIERETANAAAIYRAILQGPANARPVADSRLDLPTLQTWAEDCRTNNRMFNQVIDFRTTVFRLLDNVAAVGRAARTMRDGLYSVVRDVAQTVPVQHLTPRNSWGFSGSKAFLDLPHAFKVRFLNPDAAWQTDERIVYDDGYNADGSGGLKAATKFEVLELTGVTSADQAWRDGRYHLAVMKLRPELYEVNMDVENLICTRGDLVKVVHDVPSLGLGYARIKSVTVDGGGNATSITIDDAFTMASGTNYAVRIRRSTGASVLQQVATNPGDNTSLTFTASIPAASAPAIGDLILFGTLNSESVDCLVKSIAPARDLTAKLVLVDAAPAVLTAESGSIPPYQSQISLAPTVELQQPPAPIVDRVQSDETVLERDPDGSLHAQIVISMHFISGAPVPAAAVQVRFRQTGSLSDYQQFTTLVQGDATAVSIRPVTDGQTYDIRLRSVSALGVTSDWVPVTSHTVVGKTSKPPDVAGVAYTNGLLLWGYPAPPLDLAGFKVRKQFGVVRTWDNAQPLHDSLILQTLFVPTPDFGTVTYLVKAVDTSGNESVNALTVTVVLGGQSSPNIVDTEDYKALGFPGTKTNGAVGGGGNLEATSQSLFWKASDSALFWSSDSALFWNAIFDQMTYVDTYEPDSSLLYAALKLNATIAGSTYSVQYRPDTSALFWGNDDSALFWGADNAALFWDAKGDFLLWPGSLYPITRQAYEFKIVTEGGPTQGIISVLQALLDAPTISESLSGVAIGAGGTRLSLAKSYHTILGVSPVLLSDGSSARTVEVVDKDATLGPMVKTFDSTHTGTAGTVDVPTVVGY